MKEAFITGFEQTVRGSNSAGNQQFSGTSTGLPRSFVDVTTGRSSLQHQGDWRKLVGDKKLSYHEPILQDGKRLIQMPLTICENALSLWEDSLVGQFVGNAPSYNQIHGTANHLWGRKGVVDVMAMGNEVFLFKFKDVNTRNWVLNSCPWYLGSHPIFKREYEKGLSLE